MATYIARRVIALIPVLLALSVVVFGILWFTPGDPARTMAGIEATEEDVAMIRHELGLDQPWYVQYALFLERLAQGDLGTSIQTHQPVSTELLNRLPATIQLAIASLAIALLVGLPLGTLAAVRQNSIWDTLCMVVAAAGITMPVFWLGLMLMLLFSVQLHWLPTTGRGGLEYLVLPAITLCTGSVALFARMTRSSVLEVLRQDYVRTARAKGLGERVVVIRHTLKNAMIPTVTLIGLQFGHLLGGAVITETVFAWPGVGRLVVDAIRFRDYPVIQGTLLCLGGMFVVMNLLVDLAYVYLDPRIQYE